MSFREPLRATLIRTTVIAMVAGLVLALFTGGLSRWPQTALIMLWPAFGGHWVEVLFLNVLRPRLPSSPAVQSIVRLTVWYLAGMGFTVAMRLTATVLSGHRPPHWPTPWLGGVAFIGIELIAHLALQLRGRPAFYNGRG